MSELNENRRGGHCYGAATATKVPGRELEYRAGHLAGCVARIISRGIVRLSGHGAIIFIFIKLAGGLGGWLQQLFELSFLL